MKLFSTLGVGFVLTGFGIWIVSLQQPTILSHDQQNQVFGSEFCPEKWDIELRFDQTYILYPDGGSKLNIGFSTVAENLAKLSLSANGEWIWSDTGELVDSSATFLAGYEASMEEKFQVSIEGSYKLEDFTDPTGTFNLGASIKKEFDNGLWIKVETGTTWREGEGAGTRVEGSIGFRF